MFDKRGLADASSSGYDSELGKFAGCGFYTPQSLGLYLSIVEFHISATAVTVTALQN